MLCRYVLAAMQGTRGFERLARARYEAWSTGLCAVRHPFADLFAAADAFVVPGCARVKRELPKPLYMKPRYSRLTLPKDRTVVLTRQYSMTILHRPPRSPLLPY